MAGVVRKPHPFAIGRRQRETRSFFTHLDLKGQDLILCRGGCGAKQQSGRRQDEPEWRGQREATSMRSLHCKIHFVGGQSRLGRSVLEPLPGFRKGDHRCLDQAYAPATPTDLMGRGSRMMFQSRWQLESREPQGSDPGGYCERAQSFLAFLEGRGAYSGQKSGGERERFPPTRFHLRLPRPICHPRHQSDALPARPRRFQ